MNSGFFKTASILLLAAMLSACDAGSDSSETDPSPTVDPTSQQSPPASGIRTVATALANLSGISFVLEYLGLMPDAPAPTPPSMEQEPSPSTETDHPHQNIQY